MLGHDEGAYPSSLLARPRCMDRTNLLTVTTILGAMALLALVEGVIPLHVRGRWHRAHLGPNLGLTFITFGTNAFFSAGLMALMLWERQQDMGLLRALGFGSLMGDCVAVLLLDFSIYVAHVAMHKVPALWRVHRVHHADPVVDVTTTIRQHPLEGVIRYAFMAAFAAVLGVSLHAFVIYRLASALIGLLEHANIRLAPGLDRALAWITTSPNMHKIHHSRLPHETDSNYGNIFSWFDRAFGTFRASERGESVECGLEGYDETKVQTLHGLLSMPFAPERSRIPIASQAPAEPR
jgi:sterol desaturase/sphingolipid hydroxylase (fatty acid hydroxylase superfamily)